MRGTGFLTILTIVISISLIRLLNRGRGVVTPFPA